MQTGSSWSPTWRRTASPRPARPSPEIRAAVDIPLRVMLRVADGFAAGDIDVLVRQGARAAGRGRRRVRPRLPGRARPRRPRRRRTARRRAGRLPLDVPPRHRPRRRPGRPAQAARGPAGPRHLPHGRFARTASDDGIPTLLAEAARKGEPGYEPQILVGGGLRLEHLPELLAAGIDAFHIGGAAATRRMGRAGGRGSGAGVAGAARRTGRLAGVTGSVLDRRTGGKPGPSGD